MADPFLGEIRIFPYTFAPKGWAFCNGQSLPIRQFDALFRLLGNTFGGDGKTNFFLPALHGRIGVGAGQGPGLSSYPLGRSDGNETVVLSEAELPAHNHSLNASTAIGTTKTADKNQLAQGLGGTKSAQEMALIYSTQAATTALAPNSIAVDGLGAAHANMMPYLSLGFCIAVEGEYPTQ
jgi:microcystin-dependent protein